MAKETQFVKELADMQTDFATWYTDVCLKTELVDYGPVKGTMAIRPYGYAIWEVIQAELDRRIKETGHQNACFPTLIPFSFLQKEASHIEGFAPEVATVTHFGDEELSEKLILRPTSETIICHMYSKWVQSYRDLPVMLNQWANVFRCEKTTRPFLRTSEFLWQEGHTAHATHEEAEIETIKMLNVYQEFMKNVLAIPVLTGRKSEKEKFAGGHATYAMEAMMLDGKSLQAGTSHDLGQNFAKVFDIEFLDKDGVLKHVWQTSWGVTTRLIGAMIMSHGDQRGLVLPPVVAPYQVVIVPIAYGKNPHVLDKAREVAEELKNYGLRVVLDERDQSPGWKFNEWEMKGVPVRIEIGPKDMEKNIVMAMRRDTLEKQELGFADLAKNIAELLEDVHENMYNKAEKFLHEHIVQANDMSELKTSVDNGNFARVMWCGCPECEENIKAETGAKSLVMPLAQPRIMGKCFACGKDTGITAYFGKSY